MKQAILSILLGISTVLSFAGEIDIQADISARFFPNANIQADKNSGSLEFFVDARRDFDKGRLELELISRFDNSDVGRNVIEPRQAYYNLNFDDVDFFLGFRQVFWGVAESHNVVDIVNQTDGSANAGNEAKLGAPGVSIEKTFGDFIFQGFYLSNFRERTFNDQNGHPSNGLSIADAIYENPNGRNSNDLAFRVSTYFEETDVALSYFSGTARTPIFNRSQAQIIIPYYLNQEHVGIEAQFTGEEWLLKLEHVGGSRGNENFSSMIGGFEYTRYGILDSTTDLGFIGEYQYSDAFQSSFQDDLVSGLRWVLNDTQNTNILFLTSVDLEFDEAFYSLSAESRITDSSKLAFNVKVYNSSESKGPLMAFDDDDEVEIRLSAFF